MPKQDNFELMLAATLVVLLLVGTLLSAIVSSYAGKLIPSVTSHIICEKDGSEFVLAQPTSPQVCEKIAGMERFLEVDCGAVSSEKRFACENLQGHLSVRIGDCSNLSKEGYYSPYASGSPHATEWCDAFSA